MRTASLYPESGGRRELAISRAVSDWLDVPVELLGTLWTPATCPEDVLPHLARALGMPLWLDRWTVQRKRELLAQWVPLSRKRGVEGTFRALAAMIDAELVEFLAPPQGLYPRAGQTAAERAAFRAQFPEIRVYRQRQRHTDPVNLLVVGRPWFGKRTIVRRSIAAERMAPHAVIVDRGVSRVVPVQLDTSLSNYARGLFTVSIPTTARRLTLPAILGPGFIPRKSTAASRVYQYAAGDRDPDLLPPGEPFEITPEYVAEPRVLRGGFYVGHCLPMSPRLSRAGDRVFDSVRIYDPDRAATLPNPRKGGWILGRSNLRQKPFTLHIGLDLSRKRPGGFVIGKCLPMPVRQFDADRVEEGLAAMRAAKLGRDRVLVRTNLHRVVTAGDAVPADGSFRAGQIVRRI